MSQRTFLELTHNPFAPPKEGFYSGADRKSHLEQLRHLSQWSRRVLLVTGNFGIGKSTLFKELSSSLPGNAKGARISGSVVTSEREVLLAVAQGFGIACDQEAHLEDIVALVLRSVEEESQKERFCVVMFDDAHLLAHTAIALLMRLVAESSLRVVMFAEPALVNNLTPSAKKQEVEWFEIRLAGFPPQEVRDYLEWRFAQAQYRGRLPFTDAQVEKIAERSGGNPNVIDFMANELLADLETGQVRDLGGGFPRRHAILVVILGVLVFLVYQLYMQPPQEVVEETPIAAISSETDDLGEPEPETEPETDARDAVPSSIEPLETVSEEDATIEEVLSESAVDDAVQETDEEVIVDQVDLPQEGAVQTEEAPASVESTEEVAAEEAAQETSSAVTEEPAPIIPVEEASTPVASEIPSGINGPRWLRAQNPNHYTLQLMTLSRVQGGADLIRRQSEPGEFAMYPLARGDKLMYVVTYGVFSSQSAAEQAGRSLPGELSSIKPWIRPFSNVQDAIAD